MFRGIVDLTRHMVYIWNVHITDRRSVMHEVNVTELRNHLQMYLGQVQKGDEILVTSRGKVIARLVPGTQERLSALERVTALRGKCRVGDVVSPLDDAWEAERDHP
jgi:prevent-host-death family protein